MGRLWRSPRLVLSLPKDCFVVPPRNDNMKALLHSFVGKRMQSYPPYSSRTVQGKPLYWWAREDKLHEINIPEKEIEIFHISLISQRKISLPQLRSTIVERIGKIKGNFRQHEILQTWEDFFHVQYTGILDISQTFPLLHCTVQCSSGTYIRGIVHEIGEKLSCGALAYTITRTQVGDYELSAADMLTLQSP